ERERREHAGALRRGRHLRTLRRQDRRWRARADAASSRAMSALARFVAVVGVVVVVGAVGVVDVGCVALQTRTTGDVIVETATGHDHYSYEGIESFDTA